MESPYVVTSPPTGDSLVNHVQSPPVVVQEQSQVDEASSSREESASAAPQVQSETSDTDRLAVEGEKTPLRELFLNIRGYSKGNLDKCFFYEDHERYKVSLRNYCEKNKIEKLILTFKDQVRNKLNASEFLKVENNRITYLIEDDRECFEGVRKEFFKLSNTNLECILKRNHFFAISEINKEIKSLISTSTRFNDIRDLEFLKVLITLISNEDNFRLSLFYCLMFCNFIIDTD